MNKNISGLNPQEVWKHFAAICSIPHPSHHEDAIREYLVNFAKEQGLDYTVDEVQNVIIRKPATPGMENRKGIVLQAHMDMVPQKNGDKVFDFLKDSIEAYVDGEWVTANGTTLGADNGIGISAALAALESKSIAHGPLEALFTVSEETGMVGAFGLKSDELKGEILLNLDSETEGELYVGCAGGLDATMTLPYKTEALPKGYVGMQLTVKGLKGGHSGMEIILQRANANKVLFRFLRSVEKIGVKLESVDGGGLRNAIPREAAAVVAVPAAKAAKFKSELKKYAALVNKEFKGIEDEILIAAAETAKPRRVMTAESQKAVVNAVCGCPNGVRSMSMSMPGLVQTSSNLARVVSDGRNVKVQCLLRSSVNSEKLELAEAIASVFELAGAKVKLSGGYDGWNPNMESPILKAMIESYEKLYGVKPAVMGIHAGLECGIFGGPYPEMDMISFGPTICYPHSPDEKVEIASVGKFWDFLCYTLGNAPLK